MRKHFLGGLLLAGVLAGAASGQTTTGYLYYAGGGLQDSGIATANDGTLTTDNGVFSVLVADVAITSGTISVSSWRYAAGTTLGNPLPEDNPSTVGTTELYSWMFLENACHVYNGRLYLGPGDWNGDGSRTTAPLVAHAAINGDGSLGAWTLSDIFPASPADQAISATALVDFGASAYYYVLGGTGSGTNRVLISAIGGGGGLGAWSTTTVLPEADWFNRATVVGSTVVHATGNLATAIRQVHYATASNVDGTLGAWTSGGSYGAGAKQWDMAMTSVQSAGGNDFVVIAGGNALDGKTFVTQVTAGVPGTWSETGTMVTGVRRVSGTSAADVVFTLGGSTAGAVTGAINDVQAGRITDGGTISWVSSDATAGIAAMPQARAFGGAAFVETVPPAAAPNWPAYE